MIRISSAQPSAITGSGFTKLGKSYLPCLALEIDQVFRKYPVSLLQLCMFHFPLHPPGFYSSLFLISLIDFHSSLTSDDTTMSKYVSGRKFFKIKIFF